MKLLKLAFVAGVLLALTFLFRTTWTASIEGKNSIAELQDIKIGGVFQSLLIRGLNVDNPILLWLHGGPGGPIMPVAHTFGKDLEKNFVVVHWDQRGAGRSARFETPSESLTIEQLLADTLELIQLLRARFNKDKVYLVGHSWGSVLGLITAERHPELLMAYIGIGQATDQSRSEKMSLSYVRKKAKELGNKRALDELKDLEPPYLQNPHSIQVQRKWLSRFGGNIFDMQPFFFWGDIDQRWAVSALLSPEYSGLDLIRYLRANETIRWALFHEFKKVNFMDTITRIDVPVYFLMGIHDYNMQPSLVEEYFTALQAPAGKNLIWFENSGHGLVLEETERFNKVMVEKVLRKVQT